MAIDRERVDWKHLGREIEARRVQLEWSKEEAARKAGISSITWKRAEDGLGVQDVKLAAILRVLEIQFVLPGTATDEVVVVGGETPVRSVTVDDDSTPDLQHVALHGHPVRTQTWFQADVGPLVQDAGYVSKADPTAGTATSEQDNAVLRAVNEMRSAVDQQLRSLSERVERLEQRSEPVDRA